MDGDKTVVVALEDLLQRPLAWSFRKVFIVPSHRACVARNLKDGNKFRIGLRE